MAGLSTGDAAVLLRPVPDDEPAHSHAAEYRRRPDDVRVGAGVNARRVGEVWPSRRSLPAQPRVQRSNRQLGFLDVGVAAGVSKWSRPPLSCRDGSNPAWLVHRGPGMEYVLDAPVGSAYRPGHAQYRRYRP